MTTMSETKFSSLISDIGVQSQPKWLQSLRKSANERFGEIGFPTIRDEEWRSTPIAPIVETPFALGTAAAADSALLGSIKIDGALQIVVVNGVFDHELSKIGVLPLGVTISSLANAIEAGNPLVEQHLGKHVAYENHAFTALNTASITDGVFIHIAKHVAFEQPIHIVYLSQPGSDSTVSHPRTLVI